MSRLYHGGATGLEVGDWILPASESGALTHTQRLAGLKLIDRAGVLDTSDVHSPDRVYLTTDEKEAINWAAVWHGDKPAAGMGGGDAYEVEVEDMSACTLDPDWSYGLMLEIDAGVWWTAPRARIVRVVERGCTLSSEELDRQVEAVKRRTGIRMVPLLPVPAAAPKMAVPRTGKRKGRRR